MKMDNKMDSKAKVELIELDAIKPYWRNARNIEAAVVAVKESIANYGYNEFMVLDPNLTIIAGHARYFALTQLGYKEVKCIIIDLPEEKVRAYRIADNKTNEKATWILPDLIAELKTIPDINTMIPYFGEIPLQQMMSNEQIGNMLKTGTDQMAKAQANQDNKFGDMNKKELAEYIDVTCPHCGEDFTLKKSDILSKFAK